MSTRFTLLAFAGIVASSTCVVGAEPDGPRKDAEPACAQLVNDIGAAWMLVDFGRGRMADITRLEMFRSPDSLVAAGAIFYRASKKIATGDFGALDVKVIDANGKAVEAQGKRISLKAEAEELFDEARALAGRSRSAEIETLIKKAEQFEERCGAMAAPRAVTRTLGANDAHEFQVTYAARQRVCIAFRCDGPLELAIDDPHRRNICRAMGVTARHSWTTGNTKAETYTVRIKGATRSIAYTFITN